MHQRVLLEPEAEAVTIEAAKCPRIYQLPPKKGREVLERTQSTPVSMFPACIDRMTVQADKWGKIPVYLIYPEKIKKPAHVIFYIHGAGWVFGSFHTHEKLVRELAARTGCVVVFPEYSRAPEAKYPIAIEQCYSILCQIPEILKRIDCKMVCETLTVAGDSVGGNMAIVMTMLAKCRKGPCIQKQLLYYPVTNACFQTESYCKFAEDYYLYRTQMMWFWEQYAPCERDRNRITASPLRAGREELKGLPEAMIINGEADVLRTEGEDFGNCLRKAGVPVTAVRLRAIIHDFVMLNSLDQTRACRAAMDVSTEWIKRMNCKCDKKK